MSCIALVGSFSLFLERETLRKLLLPIVAFAAGSLIGGAFFHMIPSAVSAMGNSTSVYVWVVLGFLVFFVLEQFLNWHHCHHVEREHRKKPLTYLILIADGLHNFIGGLGVAGAFIIDIKVGIVAWIAAAAHEIPQELGDFGILVHGGWKKKSALAYNFFSASTFLLGSLLTYFLSRTINTDFLVPFAAGNFIYIAAADLVPEVNKGGILKQNLFHFIALSAGLAMLFVVKLCFE